MIDLKLKLDETGWVIRSIGAAPNGILIGTDEDGRPGFGVSPNYSPPPGASDALEGKEGAVGIDIRKAGTFDVVRIDTEDAVAAAADAATAVALWMAAVATFQVRSRQFLAKMAVEGVAAHVDFLIEVRDALADAGYIRETGGA